MFARNIIVRLHVFLMCFAIALTPAYVYALSGSTFNFTNITNAAKKSGGFVADYFFKDYAGTTYSSKGHVVSNNQMGQVWRKRWAGLTTAGGLGGVAVVAGLLAAADWILDPANNTITKVIDNGQFTLCGQTTYFQNKRHLCSPIPKEAFDNHYSEINANSNFTYIFESADIALINQVVQDYLDDHPEITLPMPLNHVALFGKMHQYDPQSGQTYIHNRYVNATIYILPTADQVIHATEQDIADAVSQADVETLTELATSPDYINEPHAPTQQAADKAREPCKAGEVRDPIKGTCLGNDNAVNPKPDPETGEKTDAFELPEFCAYAQALCDWINWTKEDVDPSSPDTKPEISEIDIDPASKQTDYVSWSRACPAPISKSVNIANNTRDFEFSFDPLCDMLESARPIIVAFGWLSGLSIVVGIRDDQG
ncbi:MAG: virulence factor TspB C-terminal domain-related protein [Pseudomonadota bacterium]|nr:virulence factor TspB C-terminal domain-related protein [Pseudomonadota bacterium]